MTAIATPVEFAPDAHEIEALKRTFNLSYHIPYAARAAREVGLAGKWVVEVGGSLPPEFVRKHLGVAQWSAIEELGYYHASAGANRVFAPLTKSYTKPLKEATAADLEHNEYLLMDGAVEDAPESLNGQYDVAFSIACFEHLSRMPRALSAMYRLLKPGGVVFSMFSPIWSAHDGHHIPTIVDAAGQRFLFNDNCPIPPWGHLLCTPSELFQQLLGKTDPTAAEEIVYYAYHSPRISRLFAEDYLRYFTLSPFKPLKVVETFRRALSPQLQVELERLHPRKRLFSNNGFLAVLQRPR
jgi:SAM-dependent methyltransferase